MANTEKPEEGVQPAAQGTPQQQQQKQQQPQQQQASQQVQLNDANALASYANFCRVTGSPEELIIDFGLNTGRG